MRQIQIGADPDLPSRDIVLPAAWPDEAAAALAVLAPGEAPATLVAAAAAWITPLAAAGRAAGIAGLAEALHSLLALRRGAAGAGLWQGIAGTPSFVLNLARFCEPGTGLDVPALAAAAQLAGTALALAAAPGEAVRVAMGGLDGMLAALGLPYDGAPAREAGAACAALVRAAATAGLLAARAGGQGDLLAEPAAWPAPPACAVPGLTQAASLAASGLLLPPGTPEVTGFVPAGPVEALLGIETTGIAPAFSPVAEGRLTQAARDRLAASGMAPEAALALSLLGENPLPPASIAAWIAMHDAIAPYVQAMPARPVARPAPPRLAERENLPARSSGFTQKALIGGHRVLLTTAQYLDGRLGGIALALPKAGPALRGMADQFAAAFSLGLQHGIALETLIEAFAGTRFGPGGVVQGDPAVGYASSIPDYVARALSAQYLGVTLPEPAAEAVLATGTDDAPLLPLDLPRGPRLRVVK